MFTYYECSRSAMAALLFVLSLSIYDNDGIFLFSYFVNNIFVNSTFVVVA